MLKLVVLYVSLQVIIIQKIGAATTNSSKPLYPVILVPGLIGSRLEAKLDRKEVEHFYCQHKSDWYDLWIGITDLLPIGVGCFEDNIKLIYNSTTRRAQNAPGVTIRPPSFGKCNSVEYLSSYKIPGTSYLQTMVSRLVELGYKRDKSIMAAPYDFRFAVNGLEDYYGDLKKLVEFTYNENDNQQPIVFICHSNGCPNIVYFLASETQTWKDKYVRSVVALGGVWAGTVKALLAYTFGTSFGPFVDAGVIRRVGRSFPGVAALLPTEEGFTDRDVLIRNKDQNYTLSDYKQLFNHLSYPEGYEMHVDNLKLISPLSIPNVELHCLYSEGVKTMEQFHWKSDGFPEKKPDIVWGDGDGTVNISSLKVCQKFKNLQEKPFHYKTYKSIEHQAMVDDREVFNYIEGVLFDRIKIQ